MTYQEIKENAQSTCAIANNIEKINLLLCDNADENKCRHNAHKANINNCNNVNPKN